MIYQKEIVLSNYKRGYHLITDWVMQNLSGLPEYGILNVLC